MLYRFNEFEIDDEIYTLRRNGADVPLRPQALDLLLYLVRHCDRVVTKAEILESVWQGISVSDSTVPQAVLAVRRALGDDSDEAALIQTVRGRGYRFAAAVEASSDEAGARAPRVDAPSDFVGRHRELEHLERLRARAAAGNGGIALISGPPGSGKTRLLAEFAARARSLRARVSECHCPAERGIPELWLWLSVLRAHAEGPPGPALREARALADELEAAASNPSEKQRFIAFDRVVETLRRAAQHEPLLIVIDDLHHADTASLLLLKFLVASLKRMPIALVVSYRDTALSSAPVLARTLGGVIREDPRRSLPLEPLGRDEVTRLVQSITGSLPDTAMIDRLVEKTSGNPMLVVQMSSGGAKHGSTSALLAQSEMKEAILLHLDVLSEDTRHVLRGASVLGVDFKLSRLASTLGLATKALLGPLEEALEKRVLAKTPAGSHRFVHVLVRDVLYRSLGLAERAALHEAAGSAALGEGAAEDAIWHLERALQVLDLLAPASVEIVDDDAKMRADALLARLRERRAQA